LRWLDLDVKAFRLQAVGPAHLHPKTPMPITTQRPATKKKTTTVEKGFSEYCRNLATAILEPKPDRNWQKVSGERVILDFGTVAEPLALAFTKGNRLAVYCRGRMRPVSLKESMAWFIHMNETEDGFGTYEGHNRWLKLIASKL
jgi:hypothetical protein